MRIQIIIFLFICLTASLKADNFGVNFIYSPEVKDWLGDGYGGAVTYAPTDWLQVGAGYQQFGDGSYHFVHNSWVFMDRHLPIETDLFSLNAKLTHDFGRLRLLAGLTLFYAESEYREYDISPNDIPFTVITETGGQWAIAPTIGASVGFSRFRIGVEASYFELDDIVPLVPPTSGPRSIDRSAVLVSILAGVQF